MRQRSSYVCGKQLDMIFFTVAKKINSMRNFHQNKNEEKFHMLLSFFFFFFFLGDGNVSFEEFVEIVSNIGGASAAAPPDQDQEEQELRDAFRVSSNTQFIFKSIFSEREKEELHSAFYSLTFG